MAIRDILICGDPVLRKKTPKVREITDEIRELLDDMVETMIDAPGVGLAAPQVGMCTRCIVVLDHSDPEEEKIYKIVNPRVQSKQGEQWAFEGCLSLPTLQAEVCRPMQITVTGQDENGNPVHLQAQGLLARALLHEIDHLDGILFIDRAEPDSIGWMIPDETDEDGYRLENATAAEVQAAFDRLRERIERQKQEASEERGE
ncbi:MAG: peptide deformylase [Armatimonadota bacterium]